MHSHRNGTFPGPVRFVAFPSGSSWPFGCATPTATRVGEDTGGKGVLESIETVVTPEKTTLIMTAPGAATDRKTYTLSDPPRICVDLGCNTGR